MVSAALDEVGKIVGAGFGDVQNPLLVSVRSGSRASMPGMMDTVLNLGLNDQTVEGLAVRSGDRRFAYDTYRRFIQMYADVVLGLDHELFEEILENYKGLKGFEYDTERRDLRRDHGARPADRLAPRAARADLPRRRGAAGPSAVRDHRRDPGRRLGDARARAALGERGRVARRRPRGRGVRRDRRQSVLRHRAARLAAVGRPAAVGRERRARARGAARRRLAPPGRARLGRAEPRARVACWTRSCRTGPTPRSSRSAGSCSRSTRRTFASATSSRGTRSGRASRSPRGGVSTPRSWKPCSPRTPTRRTSSTTRRRRARRTSSASTRSSPRAGRRSWSPTARRTRSTGAPRTSSTGCPQPEQATVLEELATAAYAVGRLEDAFAAIERAIAIYGELGDDEAVGRCTRVLSRYHWVTGDGDAARRAALEAIAILEPLGPSIELARAYSAVSQLEMLAEDVEPALEWGTRALELATRLGDERTRAHALVNIGSARLNTDGETAHAPRGARGRRRRRRPARGGARARQPRPQPHVLGAAGRGAPLRAAGGRVRHGARAVHHRVLRRHGGRLAAAARRRVGRGRAPDATRDRERHGRPAAHQDGAARAGRPARRSGCRRAAGRDRRRGRSHRRAAADRAGRSSSPPSGR